MSRKLVIPVGNRYIRTYEEYKEVGLEEFKNVNEKLYNILRKLVEKGHRVKITRLIRKHEYASTIVTVKSVRNRIYYVKTEYYTIVEETNKYNIDINDSIFYYEDGKLYTREVIEVHCRDAFARIYIPKIIADVRGIEYDDVVDGDAVILDEVDGGLCDDYSKFIEVDLDELAKVAEE